jgi:hypothetical protein
VQTKVPLGCNNGWFLRHNWLFEVAVLDTAAGVWCDRKGVVTSPRTGRFSNDAAGGEPSVELTRRCRHAAAAVGDLIFIYGGLRGGKDVAHVVLMSFFLAEGTALHFSFLTLLLCKLPLSEGARSLIETYEILLLILLTTEDV